MCAWRLATHRLRSPGCSADDRSAGSRCFAHRRRSGNDELAWLRRFIAATPGLQQGLIYTPSTTSDPYLDDGPPPLLGLQLYFDDIAALEAALAPDGYLQGLVARDALPSLADAEVTQQAMLVRPIPVPDPDVPHAAGRTVRAHIWWPMKARRRT